MKRKVFDSLRIIYDILTVGTLRFIVRGDNMFKVEIHFYHPSLTLSATIIRPLPEEGT